MNTLRRVALALVIIGAINWGLIGLFQFDLVASLFGGQDSGISRVIYTLVGLSGLVGLPLLFTSDTANDYVMGNNPDFATEFSDEPDLDRLYNPSLEAYEDEDEENL